MLAFIFARVFLEPVIGRAIGYEVARGEAQSALTGVHGHEMELFTRGIQANVGMGSGILAFAVAMGALLSVAFIIAYSRSGSVVARAQALELAAGAFVVLYLVPFLKYPANPPSISDPDTIGKRTGLYVLMIALSLVVAVLAVWIGRRLSSKLSVWGATLLGIGIYIVVIAAIMLLLPTVSELPQSLPNDQGAIAYPSFSADDLFRFRLYAVTAQLIIWATIGLVFGELVSHLLDTEESRYSPRE
jgi:amino acid transporter